MKYCNHFDITPPPRKFELFVKFAVMKFFVYSLQNHSKP